MSLNKQGQSCVVCHSYLFSEDDIVYCPTCGAPHHRDCYNSVGHCGQEKLHGSDEQYDKVHSFGETVLESEVAQDNLSECVFCHKKIENDSKVCPYCGRPRVRVEFSMLDALGGVPKDQNIGGGVTAQQARDFVGVNTARYINKFASGKKVSWNWAAFLFPQGWFLSRKMYKWGFLVIAILISATILLFPLTEILNAQLPQTTDRNALINEINKLLPTVDILPILLVLISGAINITVRIASGIFGDFWYKKYVIYMAKSDKKKEYEITDYNQKYGGVNFLMALIGMMLVSYLPTIILSLI